MHIRIDKFRKLISHIRWILSISFRIDPIKFVVRIISILLYALIPVVSAWLLKLVIDTAVYPNDFGQSSIYVLLSLIAFKIICDIGWYFLDTLLESLFQIMRFDMEGYFIEKVNEKLYNLDIDFFENSEFLDTKQKVLETYTTRPTEMLNIAFWSMYNVLQIILQSIIIFQINPLWLLLLFVFQIPSLMILLRVGQSVWNIWNADSTTRRAFVYFSGLFESISYSKEFKLYGLGTFFLDRITTLVSQFHIRQKTIEKKRLKIGFFGVFLSNFPVLYITVRLFILLIQGQITAGLLTFYLSALSVFSLALTNLVKNINFGYEVNLYINVIRSFLGIQNKIQNIPSTKNIDFSKGIAITFNHVYFSYPNSKRNVFTDFSLTINPYKKIAIVGENGSGKTTLIKLLCRFYDVQKGEILINGIDIRSLSISTLRSLYAVLFQDFVGYDLSVKENIAISSLKHKNDIKQIQKAANMAGADNFIKNLPNKYDQLLGTSFTNGEQLSAGQWQKLALAKSFMRNSPVLILDEPTASVDAKTEYEIFNRLMKLIRNKTVLIVSHRFSTVRRADEIVVLKKGVIAERGTHDTLIKKKGAYEKLYTLQANAYR